MSPEVRLPDDVTAYYERGGERSRLVEGIGRIEFLRTQRVLRRFLPAPPARVLDVGGATGVHASWLARDGYDVQLFDPLPLHIDEARAASAAQPDHPFSAQLADARSLPVQAVSADAVLLLGPLYHLVEREDRLTALAEAQRVLLPGGRLAVAAIGRYGDWFYGLQLELLDDPEFRQMALTTARTGQHRSVGGRWFTTAYFHRPEELRTECLDGGFDVRDVVAVEGVGPLLCNVEERIADPVRRDQLLEGLELTETDPSVVGVSAHLLALAVKPEEAT